MPWIRYTHGPDIARYGDQPIRVEPVELKVLTEMRRAVEVQPEELVDLPKAKLVEIAEEVGADVKKSAPKAAVAKAVAEAEGS